MLSGWVFWTSTIIILIFMYQALKEQRAANNMTLDLKDGLRTAFPIYIIADVIFYLFLFLLYNVIDPDLDQVVRDLRVGFFEEMKVNGTTTYGELPIDEVIAEAKEQDYGLTLGQIIRRLGYGIIAGFGFSLLIAMGTRIE